MRVQDLPTPALVVDVTALDHNLSAMAEALPGARLRPHVKAHKCTALAKLQAQHGHHTFTCATIREVEGMAAAGLGDDLLLANEVVDARRLGKLAARITLAVDSTETIAAAADGGVREVLIDVNVGLPRCGCAPEDAGRLADLARQRDLIVRGVMGYEGHIVGREDRAGREQGCEDSMKLLLRAHALTGGDLVSAGGTGTYDCNRWATEIQAGSYALMDTAYDKLALPFQLALSVLTTVISVEKGMTPIPNSEMGVIPFSSGFAVGNCGLKALGMDHGNPSIDSAKVLFCSDEHVTFVPTTPVRVGDVIRVIPAHVDPTVAYHERMYLVDGDLVVDTWPIDLRGW